MQKRRLSVHEVAQKTGVTVRTLHYYDEIGLLRPKEVTEAGYRLYDEDALRRLQSILLFRELRFSLKQIKEILDSDDFDQSEVLAQQIKLLEMQQKRLGEIITLAREIQEKGEKVMDFEVFDKSEIERYEKEVKERWGDSGAYQEFMGKEMKRDDYAESARKLLKIFKELGKLKEKDPDCDEVKDKIRTLQAFITKHYYTCTDEILKGLGTMYIADERFRKNIDQAGGEGTAEFAKRAIDMYLSR